MIAIAIAIVAIFVYFSLYCFISCVPSDWWDSATCLRRTAVDNQIVETFFMGYHEQRPYQSIIVGGPYTRTRINYLSHKEAIVGHNKIIVALTSGKNPESL